MKSLLPLLCICVFGLSGCSEFFSDENHGNEIDAEQPNIIYILADDLGYGDLSSYGQVNIQTPTLDRMATEGIRFTQHYSGSTVCAPSRSVLMTGLHTGHTQIRGNKEIMPVGQYPLTYGTVTIPKLLKEAGYTTGGFGKWGLGYPGSEGEPSHQGFDEFFGYMCQRRSHFFYPEFLFHDMCGVPIEKVQLEGNRVQDVSTENFQREGAGPPIEKARYSQDVITERALTFIDENKNGPFFLYLPSQIPHASLEVPEDATQIYLDENGESIFDEDTSHPFGAYTKTELPLATYAAMVTRLDSYVGMILEKLEELGLTENTLVVFTSDNGSYSEGGYHYSMHNSNGDLRGGKRDLYEGGIKVPFIAKWPGKIEAGTVSHHISYFADMMPTFAELAGAPAPPGLDGISMVPVLLGRGDQEEHDSLYWEFHAQGGKQAVRKGDWKAVKLNVSSEEDPVIELYNLNDDPGEQNDTAEHHPDIVREMEEIMQREHIPSEVFPFLQE
ncbi:MAG: arylsulfatase [Balneolaceae bacterium]